MVLPLKNLCEVGVAVDICTDSEVKELIFRIPEFLLDFKFDLEKAEKLENWMKYLLREVSHMIKHFPEYVLGKTIHHIPFVALEILKWAKFHQDKFEISFEFSKNFISNAIFTSRGLIDWEKAARELMKETSLKPTTLFSIACFNSFTDIMLQFWLQISADNKFKFSVYEIYNNEDYEDIVKLRKSELLGNNVETRSKKHDDFLLRAFKASMEIRSEVSFRYLWKQLNETDKDAAVVYFVEWFKREDLFWNSSGRNYHFFCLREPYLNMILFLYDQLGNEKMEEILNKHKMSLYVLRNLLSWPYQPFFLMKAKKISELEFFRLLLDIINKIGQEFVAKTFNYRFLLRMFWNESPEPHRMFIFKSVNHIVDEFYLWRYKIMECWGAPYFHYLILKYSTIHLTDEDEENICLILKNATEEHLERINKQIMSIEIIKKGNLRCADFLLKCLKVKDVEYFKGNLLTHFHFQDALKELLNRCNFVAVDLILKCILSLKKVKDFKNGLCEILLRHLSLEFFGSFNVLISNGLSENLDVDVGCFLSSFEKWISNREFDKANNFLQFVFSSEREVADYKEKLASYATSIIEDYNVQSEKLDEGSSFILNVLVTRDLKNFKKRFLKSVVLFQKFNNENSCN